MTIQILHIIIFQYLISVKRESLPTYKLQVTSPVQEGMNYIFSGVSNLVSLLRYDDG